MATIGGGAVADLAVPGVDEGVVRALKQRAGVHGRSAEAEHRATLVATLLTPPRRNLAELLAAMPDGGSDSDFQRAGISEARKGRRADPGEMTFWQELVRADTPHFLSAITIGELRLGIDLIRHHGDQQQAKALEQWLGQVLDD